MLYLPRHYCTQPVQCGFLREFSDCSSRCRSICQQRRTRNSPAVPSRPMMMFSVRNSNLGLCFFPFKSCVSQLSVNRFGNNFGGLMTLGQVRSSPNFCSFGPQRAEKRNIWRGKNTNLNLNSGLWSWGLSFSLSMAPISTVGQTWKARAGRRGNYDLPISMLSSTTTFHFKTTITSTGHGRPHNIPMETDYI